VCYPRYSSTNRREETSASSYPALATASPGAEPSIRRASPPASRQVGEKRACGGGSGGVELAALRTDDTRPTATEVPSEVPPSSSPKSRHRQTASSSADFVQGCQQKEEKLVAAVVFLFDSLHRARSAKTEVRSTQIHCVYY
jgi:hypothetical protein